MSADAMPALYAALARATLAAGAVGKDGTNTFHRYKYASAEALIAEAREALAAEGLCVLPRWVVRSLGDVAHFADVDVVYTVAHKDGGAFECATSTPAIEEKGRPRDKAVATALTYSLGYFLRGLLLLPRVDEATDVDRRDDTKHDPRDRPANSAQRQAPPSASPPPAPPPSKPPPPANADADLPTTLGAISTTPSTDALKVLGAVIAGMPYSPEAKGKLKAAYVARMRSLGDAEQKAAKASEDAIASRDAEGAK